MIANEWRVFGPPGTGKTTYLTRQVRRCVETFGPHKVLVASFTKTAAKEIAGRDLPLRDDQVGTLHSFCFHLLGCPEIADSPKSVKDWNNWIQDPHLKLSGAARNLEDPDNIEFGTEPGDKLLSMLNRYRARRVNVAQWHGEVSEFAVRWNIWKEETGRRDFTDLIGDVLDGEMTPPYDARFGFFDEAQDFTPLELEVVRLWGTRMDKYVLAGDDDQAIYNFRGADPTYFFGPEIPPENSIHLKQSYRVPEAVRLRATEWIKQLGDRREEKDYLPREGDGEAREGYWHWKDPDSLLAEIERVPAGKTALIIAACGYMLVPIIRLMRAQAVTYHNPYRPGWGFWNPMGKAFRALHNYLRMEHEDLNFREVWSWLQLVDVKRAGLIKGAKAWVKDMTKEATIGPTLLETKDWERIFEDGEPPVGLRWLEENSLESIKDRLSYPIRVFRKHGMTGLQTRPNVVVGTIHSVKGGEADYVYLCPDISTKQREGDYDALVRMFYVGLTRAREVLEIGLPVRYRLKVEI